MSTAVNMKRSARFTFWGRCPVTSCAAAYAMETGCSIQSALIKVIQGRWHVFCGDWAVRLEEPVALGRLFPNIIEIPK